MAKNKTKMASFLFVLLLIMLGVLAGTALFPEKQNPVAVARADKELPVVVPGKTCAFCWNNMNKKTLICTGRWRWTKAFRPI
jgi:hypothetical protein